jgi:hypothetical protein
MFCQSVINEIQVVLDAFPHYLLWAVFRKLLRSFYIMSWNSGSFEMIFCVPSCREVEDFARRLNLVWPERTHLGQDRRIGSHLW